MVKSYHSLPLSGPRTSDFYCQVDIGNKIDSRERHSSVSCKNQTQQDNLELMAQLTFQICLDLKFVFESQFFNDRSFKFSNNLPFHFLSITQLGNSSYAKSLIIVWNLGKFGTRPQILKCKFDKSHVYLTYQRNDSQMQMMQTAVLCREWKAFLHFVNIHPQIDKNLDAMAKRKWF